MTIDSRIQLEHASGNSFPAASLPRQLSSFHNFHSGETILVCGCGTSLNDLKNPDKFITIGVNDVGRKFDPTYLVVLNPPNQFNNGRFRYVEESRAKVLFTHLSLGTKHLNIVRFKLGKRGGTDCTDLTSLPFTRNSPYVALCLAIYMGANRIGLIGVDFTDDHFFAQTGRHALNKSLKQINKEYAQLAKVATEMGVEIFNLSSQSQLTAFPKKILENFDVKTKQEVKVTEKPNYENCGIFIVHYQFLSCGDVLTRGLENAARDLGIRHACANCDDSDLPTKVKHFSPDLLFVMHGRKFRQRWGNQFAAYRSAVWLLDEPYEVDDTVKTSALFDFVFLNDPSTLDRHRNAFYLPVAYDPHMHKEIAGNKRYDVGFIGGGNPTREKFLLSLKDAGLLSYIVGGPWKATGLKDLCLSKNIPPAETTALYQQTHIVINVFRDRHHYNRQNIIAHSLNPRVYEALACGALVVSEDRPEVKEVFPDLPVFNSQGELLSLTRFLLDNPDECKRIKEQCEIILSNHRYIDRLKRILEVTVCGLTCSKNIPDIPNKSQSMATLSAATKEQHWPLSGWLNHGEVSKLSDNGVIVMSKPHDQNPGSEIGLASRLSYTDVELSFEVKLSDDAVFIAKLHQQDQLDQKTNSYHLYCQVDRDYIAMHHRVFTKLQLKRGVWQKVIYRYCINYIELVIDDSVVAKIRDKRLQSGYCFLGLKGGKVWLRRVELKVLVGQGGERVKPGADNMPFPPYKILYPFSQPFTPTVSIITTVYDRIDCLYRCLRSVAQLHYKNYEHIVVCDHPPPQTLGKLLHLIEGEDYSRVMVVNLDRRYNNWGIAPASVGLHLSRGKYVCFLSDDNAYLPEHLDSLVPILDRENKIGFVYSSCLYNGVRVLSSSVPRPSKIDLGQPLFRKQLFLTYMSNRLPFEQMAWDWEMIKVFMKKGVKWKHVDKNTFIFRSAQYESRLTSQERSNSDSFQAYTNNNAPNISVIIPTYNCAEFLDWTLNSIAKQKYDLNRVELIIMDDGSIDHTRKIVEIWKRKLNLKYFKLTHKGPQVARNFGAGHARGTFLLFSDADIIFEADAFDMFESTLIDNPDASYAYCDYQRIGLLHSDHKAMPFNGQHLKKQNYISTISLLRRSDFIGFDEHIQRLQDWDMWLDMWLNHGKKGVYIPKKLFQAWVRPNGISNDNSDKTIRHQDAVQAIWNKYGLA